MRILCSDLKCAIAIEYAKVDDKRLNFVTSGNVQCYTNDYPNETEANRQLYRLITDGYIIVNKLYIKEE